MLKFLKNDNKKKSVNDEHSDLFTLENAEKLINDGSVYAFDHRKKLHRNLLDILNDKTILSFFVQYLESKNGLPLVKFWLDVETFKAVGDSSSDRTESRTSNYDNIRKERHRKVDGSDTIRDYDDCVSISTTTTTSTSNFDETEEVHSNEDDEGTNEIVLDMEKMTQPLTDDEKSKICEKNRKKDESSSESSRKFQPLILEDALRIYRKYLITDSTYPVDLPPMLLSTLSLALCSNNDSESEIDLNNLWQAFEEAQRYVFDVMENYLAEFLESSFYWNYTVDVLTSDSLCLAEIISSETALFYFMEFLEQSKDNCKLPYLEFWLSATNFRKQFEMSDEMNSNQLRTDALVIYEKWFSLQATTPLNFSNKVRTKVEEQICSSAVSSCFDEPIKIVELFLERNCFKKFIKSPLFNKHLSEVMSKIDTNEKNSSINNDCTSDITRRNSSFALKFPSKNKHRRTNSESLTRSISAQNTLLAGLDNKRIRNSTDLQIDSRLLADPDLLWRRHNSTTKLSFGRVDAYGRYERDFEMPTISTNIQIPTSRSFQLQNDSIDIDNPQSIFEQAKSSSAQNRIRNAVRKFVHLPEDSVNQEIAWQVAELIVKDVTSITLSQNENHSHS